VEPPGRREEVTALVLTARDVEALRAATPGCHGRAYLNNAGAALPTQATVDAVIAHLRLEAEIGGYLAATEAEDVLTGGRADGAALVGAHPDEIVLTTSDTAGWIKAFWGFVLAGGLRRGDRVLVDQLSYSSHYLALLQAGRLVGSEVVAAPAGGDGAVDVEALAAMLDDRVRLVAMTHVGTNCGLVNPVVEVGQAVREARARGTAYFVDACQSVGQLPFDVDAVGCDVATMTGRKFLRAPRGTGMLYVRRELQGRLDPPGIDATSADWIDGDRYEPRVGSDRLEEFEASIAARVGLANALVEARALGIEAIHDRTAALAERLRRGLLEIDGVTVEDGEAERSAIVTFRVHGGRVDASTVIGAAAGADITINSSTAPWARLDMTRRHLDEVVRASPHYYNTNDELDRLLGVVAAVSSGTRRT